MNVFSSVVPVTVAGPVSAGTIAWRARGTLHLTVVVKGTFALVPEGRMSVVDPDPIVAAEQPDPAGLGLRTAGDLAPYLGKPEVWLTGHAAVPPRFGQPSLRVELMVAQGGAVRIDKQLELDVARATGEPKRVRIAGTGPISASWPLRSRWLEGVDPRRLSGPVLDIPDALNWEYFQTAPLDQRLDGLRGDETLVLGGIVAGRPRLRTQLPAAVGVARVYRRSSTAPRPGDRVPLWPDTLQVDVDRSRCCILWRGRVPLASQAELESFRVVAALQQPGQAIAWADPFDVEEAARRASAAAPPRPQSLLDIPYSDTAALTLEDLGNIAAKAATPFEKNESPPGPMSPPAQQPPSPPAPMVGAETAALTLEDLGKIAAQAATPFQKDNAPAPGIAARPVPATPASRGEMAFTGTSALTLGEIFKIAEKPATPFEKAEAPAATASPAPPGAAPPAVLGAPAPREEMALAGTTTLTLDDLKQIAELSATPFENASPAPPQVAGPSPPALPAPPREMAFTGTSALTLGEIFKIAEKPATPFEAPRAPPAPQQIVLPASQERAPPAGAAAASTAEIARPVLLIEPDAFEELESGGLGAEFLAAMAEAGAPG